MRRREFIAGLGGAATWPVVAWAQQGERVRRIGVLMSQPADSPEAQARIAAFLQALQQLGWTEGRNIRIATRGGLGNDAARSVRIRRVGVLMNLAADDAESQTRYAVFLQALAELGWAVGRNLRIDVRWGAGDVDRYRKYAVELNSLSPDAILATNSSDCSIVATDEPNRADCIRERLRSGRSRLRDGSFAARRQRYGFYHWRIRYEREMAATTQADCTRRDARGCPS
jgi:hypothetical protein